jgi:hypothetical protein
MRDSSWRERPGDIRDIEDRADWCLERRLALWRDTVDGLFVGERAELAKAAGSGAARS